MFTEILHFAEVLPRIMIRLNLPPPFFVEFRGHTEESFYCKVSAPCFDENDNYAVRVFAGKSMEDAITAKNLASLAFIRYLMKVHKFTVIDAHYYDLIELNNPYFSNETHFPILNTGCFEVFICERTLSRSCASTYATTVLESISDVPISESGSLENPFDIDSLFSFEHDESPAMLPTSPDFMMNEIVPETSHTLESLMNIEKPFTPFHSQDLDADFLMDMCCSAEPEKKETRKFRIVLPTLKKTQPQTQMLPFENLPREKSETRNLSRPHIEKMNRKLERENIKLKARVFNYKEKMQKIQESKTKLVRMARNFVTSVTKFLMEDMVRNRRKSKKNVSYTKDVVRRGEMVTKNKVSRKHDVASASCSKGKKKLFME